MSFGDPKICSCAMPYDQCCGARNQPFWTNPYEYGRFAPQRDPELIEVLRKLTDQLERIERKWQRGPHPDVYGPYGVGRDQDDR